MSNILNLKSKKDIEPKKLGIKNISKTDAEIAIYGTIDDDGWYNDSISSKDVLNALKSMDKSVTTVHVRINSGGGSVWAGIAMNAVLRNSKKKIITYCDGIAASIASIIFMAGEERHIAKGAVVMIHKPLCGLWGNSVAMMEMIDRLDMVEDQLVTIYKSRVNLDDMQLRNFIAEETYFGSEESISHGFATHEMQDDSYVDMAACLSNAHWLRDRASIINHFKDQKKVMNDKIDNVIKDIEDYI